MGWAAKLGNAFHALSSPVRAADRIISAKESPSTVACSLPDILSPAANTFSTFGSTAGHSLILSHQRFTLCTKIGKSLALAGTDVTGVVVALVRTVKWLSE